LKQAAYAPAAGRLAAAIATICAKRRPIRDGAARRNERTCCISSSSIGPGGTVVPPTGRILENGLAPTTSRDVGENSNERVVRRTFGSGLVAAIDPQAKEIFSPDFD
jgi:hypothetical protein